MKTEDKLNEDIARASKRIEELVASGDVKKIDEKLKNQIAKFYETKSLTRLETARMIYAISHKDNKLEGAPKDYSDYAEVIAAAYYAMYYIVHSYLAHEYKTKLREDLRGVHAITQYIILYYLVKTKKLAKHLYEEYISTRETAAEIQKLSVDDFQKQAYVYAEKYDRSRTALETFTYKTTPSVESYHAEQAIRTAEEFINRIRQLMLPR